MSAHRIVLVDHGSRRAEANAATQATGRALAERLGLPVEACHMELADPAWCDVLTRLGDDPELRRLTVIPLFFVEGKHFVEDIETPLQAVRGRRPDLQVELLPPFTAQSGFIEYLAALAGS